jgi:hypothetical protein
LKNATDSLAYQFNHWVRRRVKIFAVAIAEPAGSSPLAYLRSVALLIYTLGFDGCGLHMFCDYFIDFSC